MGENRIDGYFQPSKNTVIFEKFDFAANPVEGVIEDDEDELGSTKFKVTPNKNALNDIKTWVGNTKKDLSKKLIFELCSVEGVELLHIYSRYRFLLGVGKLFNDSVVKSKIIEIIQNHQN